MERFFLKLKKERVWRRDSANQEEAMRDVADCIVECYNARHLHSALGWLSPKAFERNSTGKALSEVSGNT